VTLYIRLFDFVVLYKRNCILATLFSCRSDVVQTTSSLYGRSGGSYGVRKGVSTVLTVRVRYIIKAPLV